MSYIAWTSDDGQMWWSEPDAFGLGAPRLIPDRRSTAGPALGFSGNDVFMAWIGSWVDPEGFGPVTLDTTLWWSGFDRERNEWRPQQHLPDRRSRVSPALTRDASGRPLMVWADEEYGTLRWSTMDLAGGQWLPPRNVDLSGVASTAPAAAARNTAYVAWSDGGPGLRWTSLNPVEGVWFASELVRVPGTDFGPALAAGTAGDPPLTLAWKGRDPDTRIWWSAFDGSTWGPQASLDDRHTTAAPALGIIGGSLLMAWTWENTVHWSIYGGGIWSAPRVIVGSQTSRSPALPN
jgi:hypothetical protein